MAGFHSASLDLQPRIRVVKATVAKTNRPSGARESRKPRPLPVTALSFAQSRKRRKAQAAMWGCQQKGGSPGQPDVMSRAGAWEPEKT
jgi:hypothetical protein